MPDLPLTLETYRRTWNEIPAFRDPETLGRFETLAKESKGANRDHFPGHFTASALILSPDLKRALFTHHRKLDRWLQLGGHADGDFDLSRVAMREAEEESGLQGLSFLKYEADLGSNEHPLCFDLDIHTIPARKTDPEHLHYDARYLIVAKEPGAIVCSEESIDLRWFSLEEIPRITEEESILRLIRKLQYLCERGSAKPLLD